MQVTHIKRQLKRADRYSVFLDGKYAFSLSDKTLLESKLAPGQELTPKQVKQFKQLADDEKLYSQALRYVALRARSRWEVETYLKRKKASPALTEIILNKLSIIGILDDTKFATAFVNDRKLLRPASRRKIIAELRAKKIEEGIIQKLMADYRSDEQAALLAVIEQKRRQPKYQNELKLMQYLARQGFSYGDIKDALCQLDS